MNLDASRLLFIKKETPAPVFSYEICEVFKKNYFVDHNDPLFHEMDAQ